MPRLPPDEAASRLLHAGAVPVEPYPGVRKPWAAICIECGKDISPTLHHIKDGHGPCRSCRGRARHANERRQQAGAATAELIALGFTPTAEYPGTGRPWRSVCQRCGLIVHPVLEFARRGVGCLECARSDRPSRVGFVEEVALPRMRAHALEPLEPWPGSVHKPWRARCGVCGAETVVKLSNVSRHLLKGCDSCPQPRQRVSGGST